LAFLLGLFPLFFLLLNSSRIHCVSTCGQWTKPNLIGTFWLMRLCSSSLIMHFRYIKSLNVLDKLLWFCPKTIWEGVAACHNRDMAPLATVEPVTLHLPASLRSAASARGRRL
jgi:hypothetical protein